MTSLRVLIVEDEKLCADLLGAHLSRLGGVDVVGTCASLSAATAFASEGGTADIVFLDINLPGGSGFDALRVLRPNAPNDRRDPPAIIFTTAHAEHAIEAFEVEAVDYLLKPVTFDAVERAVRRARARLTGAPDRPQAIRVPTVGGADVLRLDQVEWAHAAGDYVDLHLANGQTRQLRKTLAGVAALIGPELCRVHRSFLVRKAAIRRVIGRQHGDGLLVLASGAEVPVSRRYRDAVAEYF